MLRVPDDDDLAALAARRLERAGFRVRCGKTTVTLLLCDALRSLVDAVFAPEDGGAGTDAEGKAPAVRCAPELSRGSVLDVHRACHEWMLGMRGEGVVVCGPV